MRGRTTAMGLAVVGVMALVTGACTGGDQGHDDRVSIRDVMGLHEFSEENAKAIDAEIQGLIAACMKREGWEYTPVIYPDSSYDMSDESRIEYLKRAGLGPAYYALYPDGDPNYLDPSASFVDPNQDYVTSLGPAEQAAYEASLYGTEEERAATSTMDAETGVVTITSFGKQPGCEGEANREYFGDTLGDSPEAQTLADFYADLDTMIEADPRIVRLGQEWATCMADEGYDYADQQDFWVRAATQAQERVDQIVGEGYGDDPMAGWTQERKDEFFATATEAEWDALWVKEPLTDTQKSALEEALALEVDEAIAEFECSGAYRKAHAEIAAEVEEGFALEHRDELEQLAVAFGRQ